MSDSKSEIVAIQEGSPSISPTSKTGQPRTVIAGNSVAEAGGGLSFSGEVLHVAEDIKLLQTLCEIRPDAKPLVQEYQQLVQGSKAGACTSLAQLVSKIVTAIVTNKKILRSSWPVSAVNDRNVFEVGFERDSFETLCQLAKEDLIKGCVISSPEDSLHFLSKFCCEHDLGTFDCQKWFGFVLQENIESYKFLHPLLEEYLAAFALSQLPPLDQIQFLAEHLLNLFKKRHAYWLQFFIGISFHKEDSEFNTTTMMTSTLVDVICHYLDIVNHQEYIPIVLRCIHEADEPSIWHKIAKNHVELFSVEVTNPDKAEYAIVSMVTHSGISHWTVEASESNVGSIKEILQIKNVLVIQRDESCKKIKIYPRHPDVCVLKRCTHGANCFEHNLNSFLTQASKEILIKILQLYSKIKLIEGEDNISYVSLISCKCFQQAVEADVTFEPTLPLHFLEITPKNKNSTARSGPDELHLETHGGYTNELVLLNKPFLRSVTFTVPQTLQTYSIQFSSSSICSECYSSLSSHGYGDIACQIVGSNIAQDVECGAEIAANVDHTMTQMVYPLIPELEKAKELREQCTTRTPVLSQQNSELPKSVELEEACESQTQPPSPLQAIDEQCADSEVNVQAIVEPQPTELKVSDLAGDPKSDDTCTQTSNQVQVAQTDEHLQQSNEAAAVSTLNSCPNPQFSKVQPSPSLKRNNPGAGLVKKEDQAIRTDKQCRPFVANQSSKRQESYPPGTVLYTSLPREIPTDQLQPLPDESQLIRRGGNGAIFAGTLKGMSLAIKKTHYRSKEFNILTKIRHPNIILILAIILGEELPSSLKRFHSYHLMPRLTSDLARMLTDKKELTLKNLRVEHRENPRLLGLMMNNVKFVIREILHGLDYLHSKHIAHRDIKGGNVLLKFFCSCEHPLECGCTSKYQVVLTDFDAAIELDAQDHLPPSSSSAHNHTHPPRYQCVPVGTNGYRAPECSMHVVTSSPNSFSPPISTKCDIWSVGVLVSRMLVGYEGVYSQREMAVLGLRYHQIGGFVEGVSRYNIAHVDDYMLESVLQLSSLKREMCWMSHASEFVRSSMELDPSKRLSANQLLKHPFLC